MNKREKLDLYTVDKEYILFLQQKEKEKRGFTRVPYMCYEGRKQKFLCGTVLKTPIDNLHYFVPVTSYKKQKSENILIIIPEDKKQIKGSLRFNFMVPVPQKLIIPKNINEETDLKYKKLLRKELKFIRENTDIIIEKALDVHKKITTGECSQNLLYNSCDFKLLEEKCLEYEQHVLNKKESIVHNKVSINDKLQNIKKGRLQNTKNNDISL